MKSQKQFILDTLLPYKEDPETCAIVGVQCEYLTKDGRKCAVGKHMKKGRWQTQITDIIGINKHFDLDKVLKKSALKQGFTIEQWLLIQRYHDKCASYSDKLVMNFIVKRLEESLDIDLTELKF
tara:strand:+ start:174 stop:545 length:372 start_codon:yes stop_codon:yes gene_type:complete